MHVPTRKVRAGLSLKQNPDEFGRDNPMAVKPIPDGFHTVTPYVTVRDAGKVIAFLKAAFNAEIGHDPIKRPDGSVMHAHVKIGNSRVMIADEMEGMKATPSTLYLYVP